jgi:hypothetical protein
LSINFSYSKQLETRGVYPRVFSANVLLQVLLFNGYVLAQQSLASDRLNVLLIAVDDLRPELGWYGVSTIKTPYIDRLAQRGIVFQYAYCQSAICAPSRASLLTGLRPDKAGVHDLFTSIRKANPDIVTLPQKKIKRKKIICPKASSIVNKCKDSIIR